MLDYYSRGFPKDWGLCECGFILRRHTPEVKRFNEIWWSEYCKHSSRDQLSMPVALNASGVDLNVIDMPYHHDDQGQLLRGDILEQIRHLK
jgi:hypothetical protein